MTVQNNLNKHIYIGDGEITEFPYTFTLHHESHMKVYVVDLEGSETLLEGNYKVDMYHYKVIYPLSGDPLPPGHKLILYREVPVTQEMDLTNQGALPNETLEKAYDKLTLIAQQHDEAIKRSLKASLAHPGGVFDWPVPAPGKVVGWNEDGTGMANYDNPSESASKARAEADRAEEAADRAEAVADAVGDATHEATPNTLIRRAANGTAKVAAPVEADDIARKAEVDALKVEKKHSLIYLGESDDYGDIIQAIAIDDDFVYVGGSTTNKVYKLNKKDLSKVAESVDYGDMIRAIAVDDDFVYVGGGTTSGKIYKLNKSDLSKVAESINYGGAIWAIAVDDDFIYVGGSTTRKVYKLNKSDLSKVAESIDYGDVIWAIAIDDDFVYVGGATTRKVYKFNKSDLSKVAESINYGGTIGAIAVDDDFVYIGGYTTRKVYKLNKTDLSKVAESINYGGTIEAMAIDDDFVYIGGQITNKIYKLLNLVSLKN